MSGTAFVRQVFAWLHQVNGDHELPASAAKVAIYLSSCFNEEEGGMAWPPTEKISKTIGKVRSVVMDALRQLEARGHLRAEWGKQGQGHSGHYWMILKPREAKVSETMKRRPADISKRRPADISGASKKSVSTPQNVGFDHSETSASRHDSSKTHRRLIERRLSPDDASFEEFWRHYPKEGSQRASAESVPASKTQSVGGRASHRRHEVRRRAHRAGRQVHEVSGRVAQR